MSAIYVSYFIDKVKIGLSDQQQGQQYFFYLLLTRFLVFVKKNKKNNNINISANTDLSLTKL